jgi:hypothetical protein
MIIHYNVVTSVTACSCGPSLAVCENYNVEETAGRCEIMQWEDIITWSYNCRGTVIPLEIRAHIIMSQCE